MSVTIATFPVAPRDREVGIVPRIMLLSALAFAVAGVVLLALSPAYGGAALAVALLDGLVASWLLAIEPVAYVVRNDGLTVERRRWRPREFTGSISDVRRSEIGVAGDGEEDAVDAFVTSSGSVVLMRVGETRIAVSPADPSSFVAAAGGFRA